MINLQTRAHGGAQGYALQVDTLGGGRLGFLQVSQQSFDVLLQLDRLETDLAYGAVNDAVLVGTVAHLASLGVLHGGSHVSGNGTDFRVRHQAAGTQYLTQLADNAHGVGGSNDHVVVQITGLHFGSQVVHADLVSTGSQCGFGVGTLGEYGNANGRSEEHTSELQSRPHLVCRLLLEKKKKKIKRHK